MWLGLLPERRKNNELWTMTQQKLRQWISLPFSAATWSGYIGIGSIGPLFSTVLISVVDRSVVVHLSRCSTQGSTRISYLVGDRAIALIETSLFSRNAHGHTTGTVYILMLKPHRANDANVTNSYDFLLHCIIETKTTTSKFCMRILDIWRLSQSERASSIDLAPPSQTTLLSLLNAKRIGPLSLGKGSSELPLCDWGVGEATPWAQSKGMTRLHLYGVSSFV